MEDQRIDRTDLLGSPKHEPNSPDPVLESYFRQQLDQLYADPSEALATYGGIEADEISRDIGEQVQDEEEEYDFRLFTKPSSLGSTSVGASNIPQRITLKSPSPADDELALAGRGRPDEYYFAGHTDAQLMEQYVRAAVSGQDLIEGLKMRWRGMELPWRITRTTTTEPGKVVRLDHQSRTQTSSRKRNGKKRRIVIRQKLEARAAKEAVARQSQAEKEVAEREKRTRKNRERKVKKRQKDKLKKNSDVQDSG